MAQTRFDSLLSEQTQATFECVVDVGIRTWGPSSIHATRDDGLVHLFYLLDGIITCQRTTHLTRVLPRELLRIGRDDERELENPSRSDQAIAIQISLRPSQPESTSTRNHYFSDDQKDNQLCRVAALKRDGPTLATGAPIDVYLTTLNRYDTLLVDRAPTQPLLVLCPRGRASVDAVAMEALSPAVAPTGETATIVGVKPCTIMTLRGHRSHPL